MTAKTISKLRLTLPGIALALLLTPPLMAEEPLGSVVRSENMPGYPVGQEITRGSQISTGARQRIAIKTRSGDVVVSGENSTIKLVEPGFFQQLFGKIYYFITPKSRNQLKVRTSTATIGVRGTTFIVDSAGLAEQKDEVSLSEGALSLESNDDQPFALYRQRELTEYERYKRELQSEYDAYKNQMMEEFVAYKQSINLDQGFALSFDGQKVVQVPLDEKVEAEFTEFEKFLQENSPE